MTIIAPPVQDAQSQEQQPKAWAKTPAAAIATMTDWLKVLVEPGSVCELRMLECKEGYGKPHTKSGIFDTEHLQDMAKAALDHTRIAKGVYFTLNPLHPDLLGRRFNRLDRAEDDGQATDADVIRRRWLLIDADPSRLSGISSTDAEKEYSRELIQEVREFLDNRNWPDPIYADSGNGYHLLYRIDLPAKDSWAECVLKALAHDFDSDRASIDTNVFNPARICKLPGTLARKGDHVPGWRPHRWSKLLEVPE